MRALPRERPATLTLEPDGMTLERVIGDLQSEWGVPQSPQEYRITIKVADERDDRGQRSATVEETLEDPPDDHSVEPGGTARREKAPAAPRISSGAPAGQPSAAATGGRRRRGRRRKRGRGGGGPGGS